MFIRILYYWRFLDIEVCTWNSTYVNSSSYCYYLSVNALCNFDTLDSVFYNFYSQSSQSNADGWTIQLGITRRHAHSYFGQKMKVQRVVPHPMYNMGVAHDNDVALFQVCMCRSKRYILHLAYKTSLFIYRPEVCDFVIQQVIVLSVDLVYASFSFSNGTWWHITNK